MSLALTLVSFAALAATLPTAQGERVCFYSQPGCTGPEKCQQTKPNTNTCMPAVLATHATLNQMSALEGGQYQLVIYPDPLCIAPFLRVATSLNTCTDTSPIPVVGDVSVKVLPDPPNSTTTTMRLTTTAPATTVTPPPPTTAAINTATAEATTTISSSHVISMRVDWLAGLLAVATMWPMIGDM